MQPDNSIPPVPPVAPQPVVTPPPVVQPAAEPVPQPVVVAQPQPIPTPVAAPASPQPIESYQPPQQMEAATQPIVHMQATPTALPVQPEVVDLTSTQDDGAEVGDTVSPGEIPREGDEELVRWQAMEYIQREKNQVWYIGLAVISLLMMIAAWFLMKAITFVVLIPVMAAALVVYARRPPAVLDYTLSRKGLHVNDKLYDFDQFKEFGLVKGDDENSVLLVPRRRFQPGLTVYFPEDAGEAVVDMLAARLPMREINLDFVDRLTRFLRI